MQEISFNQASCLGSIYDYTDESIVKAFTQGHMGRCWVDRYPDPTCAIINLNSFWIPAGDTAADGARQLIKKVTYGDIIAQDISWGTLIEVVFGERARKFIRYAIKKEPDVFDRKHLERCAASLPEEFSLRQIDSELHDQCLMSDDTAGFVNNFSSKEDFLERGLGFCAVKDGRIIGGASSFSIYTNGLEVEIDTVEQYRRRGIALASGAKLILACLDRGWYPSWDAANLESVRLAEKLGYNFSHEYDTYEIKGEIKC